MTVPPLWRLEIAHVRRLLLAQIRRDGTRKVTGSAHSAQEAKTTTTAIQTAVRKHGVAVPGRLSTGRTMRTTKTSAMIVLVVVVKVGMANIGHRDAKGKSMRMRKNMHIVTRKTLVDRTVTETANTREARMIPKKVDHTNHAAKNNAKNACHLNQPSVAIEGCIEIIP